MPTLASKERTAMDDENFKDLARRAFELYERMLELEKSMLDIFFYEFLDLEEWEQNLGTRSTELPF
jgi:hypothetical protein